VAAFKGQPLKNRVLNQGQCEGGRGYWRAYKRRSTPQTVNCATERFVGSSSHCPSRHRYPWCCMGAGFSAGVRLVLQSTPGPCACPGVIAAFLLSVDFAAGAEMLHARAPPWAPGFSAGVRVVLRSPGPCACPGVIAAFLLSVDFAAAGVETPRRAPRACCCMGRGI
jgi:hypothetical protein